MAVRTATALAMLALLTGCGPTREPPLPPPVMAAEPELAEPRVAAVEEEMEGFLRQEIGATAEPLRVERLSLPRDANPAALAEHYIMTLPIGWWRDRALNAPFERRFWAYGLRGEAGEVLTLAGAHAAWFPDAPALPFIIVTNLPPREP